jgi:tetratricopeptide (TPR) repeat protein
VKRLATLSAGVLLTACASVAPPPQPPAHLLKDELFGAPTERIDARDIFALSPAMVEFLRDRLGTRPAQRRGHVALARALYGDRTPWIEYDATRTRTASEAFEARAGNCLSLVVMTAALAKHLGLTVRYQQAEEASGWIRSDDLLLRSGHVNLVLGPEWTGARAGLGGDAVLIDFLPPDDLKGLRVREIAEATVVAMFMNNRAVEAIVQGRLDDGYAWAREALRQDAGFAGVYNTLGLLYARRGESAQAALVLEHALARWPGSREALVNLAIVYEDMGRDEQAQALRRRLAYLEPVPPYHHFQLGRAALARGDAGEARRHFERELARDRHNAEAHFGLAQALIAMGELRAAERALRSAVDFSTRHAERTLYAGKLDGLRAQASRGQAPDAGGPRRAPQADPGD